MPDDSWVLELDDSPFLTDCRANDAQRTADALSRHRHFIVLDGNHRVIDVVAVTAHLREHRGGLTLDVARAIEDDDWSL